MKKETTITLISCVFFIISSLFFINNDFWQDEIYTLTHFVFTPFTTTLFDYHVANNHIAFNFLLNVLRRVIGINEVQEILNHPYYFRILPFTISVLNLFVIYVTSKQLYHKKFALIATSVFATTFTVINFSVQLRGYSLNILVCTLLMYYFLRMIRMQQFQFKNFMLLLMLSACSIFVLPTNVYLVLALCVLIMLFFINPYLQKYFLENELKRLELIKLIVSLLLGAAIATAFYVWLLSIQYSKEMTLPVQHFSLKNLIQALAVWYHFIHFHFHFYVLLAVFAFLVFIKREKFSDSNILLLTAVYVLCFIIFFLHGVVIIQRIFLSLIPAYVLFMATLIYDLNERKVFKNFLPIMLSLNVLALAISFAVANTTAELNNKNEVHTQDLINSYYQFYFNPKDAVIQAQQLAHEKNAAIYVQEGFGGSGIALYLNVFKIPFQYFDLKEIALPNSFIIVSNIKNKTEQWLNENEFLFEKKMDNKFHFNVYYCYKKKL